MPPFPPQILHALLSEPSRHVPNHAAGRLRKRSAGSRFWRRRRHELRLDERNRVTTSTVRLGDEPSTTT